MKHTYTKRTPILTLFTIFALALGSQWVNGQNFTNGNFDGFDNSTPNNWSRSASSEMDWSLADAADSHVGNTVELTTTTGGNRTFFQRITLSGNFTVGKSYSVKVFAKTNNVNNETISLRYRYFTDKNNKTDWTESDTETLTSSFIEYSFEFEHTATTEDNIDLGFNFPVGGTFFIDEASVSEIQSNPTVTITSDDVTSGNSEINPVSLTFTTSESTTDFDGVAADFTIVNGTLSNFSGSGNTYTASFTASTADSPSSITVNSGAFTVSNTNNTASDTFTYTYNSCSMNVTLGDATFTCGEYTEANGNNPRTYTYTAQVSITNNDNTDYNITDFTGATFTPSTIPANSTRSVTVTATDINTFTVVFDECSATTKDYTTDCNYFEFTNRINATNNNAKWNDAGNWTKGVIPSATDQVIITEDPDNTDTFCVSKNASTKYSNLIIQANATLQVWAGNELAVENFENNGTLRLTSYGGPDKDWNERRYANFTLDNQPTGTGTVIYGLHVEQTTSDADKSVSLIGAPLKGETFTAFLANTDSEGNNSDILKQSDLGAGSDSKKLFGPYDPATDSYTNWDSSSDGSNTIDAGIGYRVARNASEGRIIFKGAIHIGNLNVITTANSWNFIGNPYTSGLDITQFVADNTAKLDSGAQSIYVWEYTTPWTINSNATIPPGQGFFIKTSATGTSIDFKTTQQTYDNDGAYTGGAASRANTSNIKIKLDDLKATVLEFNNSNSIAVDPGFDFLAINQDLKNNAIYTQIADASRTDAFAIQAISSENLNTINIKLGVHATQGQHTIKIERVDLPENVNVYLTDLANGSETLLNKHDYTFNVTEAPLEGADRFIISFQSDALSTGNNNLEQLQIAAFKNTITVKGDLKNNTTLKVYDLQGRKVAQTALSNNNRQLTVNNSTGIYLVNLSNAQGSKTQKVILK